MHRIRIWIRGFFGFSRKETNAFLILLPLMIIILVSEPIYRKWKFRNNNGNFFDQHYTDSLLATLKYPAKDSSVTPPRFKKEIHFAAFDPNTVSEQDLAAMGLSTLVAGRIARYREKGGRFKRKEDLLRIYGMDSSWYTDASGWITMAEAPAQTNWRTQIHNKEPKKPDIIDINSADSIQLVNVFGVGPALSRRIRNYRDKLGGFASMEQLSEVYGLDSLALKEIKKRFALSPEFVPRQMDINSYALDELIKHPYIKRKEAQAIVNYRNQHGDFETLDDLLRVQVVNSAWLQKARPYLRTTSASPDSRR